MALGTLIPDFCSCIQMPFEPALGLRRYLETGLNESMFDVLPLRPTESDCAELTMHPIDR